MTSMLLIESAIARAGSTSAAIEATLSTTPLQLLRAIAWRDLLFRRVLCCALLDHFPNQCAIARTERRYRREFLAVPLLESHHAGAFVVEATRLHRREQTRCAELLQPRFGQIEMLE